VGIFAVVVVVAAVPSQVLVCQSHRGEK
jgi:hypothetical protein